MLPVDYIVSRRQSIGILGARTVNPVKRVPLHPLEGRLRKLVPPLLGRGNPRKRATARPAANRKDRPQVPVVPLHPGQRVQTALFGVDVNLRVGILVEEPEGASGLGARGGRC